jgi:class 3 adenylate cyclase
LDSIGKIGVSKESTLLTKGVAVSAEHIQELEQNISFIAKDFSSFLIPKSRSELPYTFDAAFLRFDINGYTRLYFKQHKRRITELISRIARDVDEIANRYNGFHYSFGGDEFIDVFDGEDGIVRAFFAARAIFSLSENLDKDLSTKIRFKASIHRDKQTLFDKIPQCYTLTSDSLVFTARFFDAVEDRDNNSLMVGEVDLESIREFSQTEGGDTHKFKNVEEPIRVYRALLNQSSNIYLNPAFVPYLRTNNDILQLITLAPEVENDLKASILKSLKSIPVSFGSESFRDAWLSALTSFDKAKNFIHLSSFINTGKNLITKDCWTVELTECVCASC